MYISTILIVSQRLHHFICRQFDYQASSPDEKALVEGCAKVGYLFTGEKGQFLNIKLQSQRVSALLIDFLFEIHID